MTSISAVVILFRDPILKVLGGNRATEAVTILILVATAQAINGAVFWNTGLLFAAGRAGIVTAVALIGMGIQVGLVVPLSILYGATGAAGALLVTYASTNVILTALAIRTLRRPSAARGREPAQESSSLASR
jgi:O-antigen/teichoic acid export membrane protein